VNSNWGGQGRYREILEQVGLIARNDENGDRFFEEAWDFSSTNLNAVRDCIRELAGRDGAPRIVLRPHPSENSDLWRALAEEVPSLVIVEQSDPTPWSLAADMMIVPGGTTGMEAVIMGRDALNLIAKPESDWFGVFMADKVCVQVNEVGDAVDLALGAVNGNRRAFEESLDERRDILAKHIAVNDDGPAYEKMGAFMDELKPTNAGNAEVISMLHRPEFSEKLDIQKTAWEKAYAPPEDIGGRLSQLMSKTGEHFKGNAKRVGFGLLLLYPT